MHKKFESSIWNLKNFLNTIIIHLEFRYPQQNLVVVLFRRDQKAQKIVLFVWFLILQNSAYSSYHPKYYNLLFRILEYNFFLFSLSPPKCLSSSSNEKKNKNDRKQSEREKQKGHRHLTRHNRDENSLENHKKVAQRPKSSSASASHHYWNHQHC